MSRTPGNAMELFPAPEPEDFLAATNSYLKIIMYATDDNGLTTEIFVDVQPKKVQVSINSIPKGLTVLVDEYSVTTPETVTSWENFNLPLVIENQPPFKFSHWMKSSDTTVATERIVEINVNTSDMEKNVNITELSLTAVFCIDAQFCSARAEVQCCTGSCVDGYCVGDDSNISPPVDEENDGTTSNPPEISTTAGAVTNGSMMMIPTMVLIILALM